MKENISMNCDYLEKLLIDIDNSKDKNVIFNLVYWPLNGSTKIFHRYLKLFLERTTISNKNIVLIGDFSLTLLNFCHNNGIKIYVNESLKNNLSLIKIPTHVTSKSLSAIDYLNTKFLLNSNFKPSVIQRNLSDHLLFL